MTERDTLEWSDIGRGLITLIKKAGPLTRTVMTLARQSEQRHMSLGAALERTAAAHPEAVALKHEHGAMTYRVFNEWVNRIAHQLVHSGVQRGDAVAILMDSRPALLAVVAAVAKVGGVAALLNTNQRRHALLHSLSCFTPVFFIIGEELVDAFEEVRPELGPIRAGALCHVRDEGAGPVPVGYLDLDAAITAQSSANPDITGDIRAGDPCFYILTSGTTGLPKASILSHDRWIKAATAFGESCLNLSPGDTLYAPLPLYHNLALTVGWASAVYTGAALAIRRKLSVSAFWDDCRRHQATAFAYIGELPRYLFNAPPTPADRDNPVRKIIGVGLRPEIWRAFKRRFDIDEVYEIYAASELNISFINLLNLDRTVGFCPMRWALVAFDADTGKPVRDARGRLVRVAKGEVGLLIAKVTRRFRFDGYTDPAASERKLLRDAFRPGDVWIDSGDLMRHIGFGHLQFVDRLGDTFRWKSENVSTGEVEAVIGMSPQVAECTVYGVEIPGMPGRAGMAAVVPSSDAFDADALLTHMRAELPAYAIPVFLRVTGSLETTGTFKHRKVELRREGYDLARTDDPILVLLPGEGAFTRLTSALHERIRGGDVRF